MSTKIDNSWLKLLNLKGSTSQRTKAIKYHTLRWTMELFGVRKGTLVSTQVVICCVHEISKQRGAAHKENSQSCWKIRPT